MLGLTVQVVGTDLSALVGEAGTFRIADVPAGQVRLQFRSDSVNATTELQNVAPDQIIQIEVEVTATSAIIVTEARLGKVVMCHAEGNGSYHAIEISDDAEADHRAHGDGEVGDPVPGRPAMTFGPDCQPDGADVEIEKTTNGKEADRAPGPQLTVGAAVTWEYHVTNTGTIPLTGIAVVDDRGVIVSCAGLSALAAKASMTCTGAGIATLGQYRNVGTVTASWANAGLSGTVTDSDASHYLGVTPEAEDEGVKVTLCHRTGAGFYNRISVDIDAEPAHLAHGDGYPGGAVPNSPGQVFSATCTVQ
jgi:hypothetical protein